MEIKEFTEKVKEKKYEVEHLYSKSDPLNGAFVVSKDNKYHVAVKSSIILKEPFDYVMSFIEEEIEQLKRKLAREAWDNLKNEIIKVFKIYEIENWLERNLRKIKWLR